AAPRGRRPFPLACMRIPPHAEIRARTRRETQADPAVAAGRPAPPGPQPHSTSRPRFSHTTFRGIFRPGGGAKNRSGPTRESRVEPDLWVYNIIRDVRRRWRASIVGAFPRAPAAPAPGKAGRRDRASPPQKERSLAKTLEWRQSRNSEASVPDKPH